MGIVYCNINANDPNGGFVQVNLSENNSGEKENDQKLMSKFIRHLPDSPRWMLRNGRIPEAMEILIAGGTKNKRVIPDNLENLLKQEIDSG